MFPFAADALIFHKVLVDIAFHKIPFAVVGSNSIVVTPDGRKVHGRAYPWGVIEADNEDHFDFVKLHQMLICTYMGVVRDPTVFKEVNPTVRNHEEQVMHDALFTSTTTVNVPFQSDSAERAITSTHSDTLLRRRRGSTGIR
jgi:septin 7